MPCRCHEMSSIVRRNVRVVLVTMRRACLLVALASGSTGRFSEPLCGSQDLHATSELTGHQFRDRRERFADTNTTNRHRRDNRPGVGVERIGDGVCSQSIR